MSPSFSIRNQKYFKPFDDSDNPCCWQVGVIGSDIEKILDTILQDYETMYEDWGVAYSWRNVNGVSHVLMVECVDVATAEYAFHPKAYRKHFIFQRAVPDADSDFLTLLPALKILNEET